MFTSTEFNLNPFPELFLFTTDSEVARWALHAGVDGFVVDWEQTGKSDRQKEYDTQIGKDTLEDLHRLHTDVPDASILVRVEAEPEIMQRQIEDAVAGGASLIMQPMARSVQDVERFLGYLDGRAKSVIQIETEDLYRQRYEMADLPWDYAYIGLNDLAISRGREWLFEAFIDGTVDDIFEALPGRNIGLAGLTIVSGGFPLPFPKLFSEMARLGCAMTFLRRSFHREIVGRDLTAELGAARSLWAAFQERTAEAKTGDRKLFEEAIWHHAVSIGIKKG